MVIVSPTVQALVTCPTPAPDEPRALHQHRMSSSLSSTTIAPLLTSLTTVLNQQRTYHLTPNGFPLLRCQPFPHFDPARQHQSVFRVVKIFTYAVRVPKNRYVIIVTFNNLFSNNLLFGRSTLCSSPVTFTTHGTI